MRVALLHNSSAGSEDHTDDELVELIQRAGHAVTDVVGTLNDLTAVLQNGRCDLVVVAGGDGTVGRAASELSGWNVPLTILPFGTANNTARALQLPQPPASLARSWHTASRIPFDLAFLDDGAVRQRFSEGVGWGVFPSAIAEAKRQPRGGAKPPEKLKSDRKLFRAMAEKAPLRHYQIDVDGRDYSGDYVLVEVVNIRFIGPQLEVSPSSDPGDGALELVMAGEGERTALVSLTQSGKLDSQSLPAGRGCKISVGTSDGTLHRDGRLVRHAPGHRIFQISVEPQAIHYLRSELSPAGEGALSNRT